MTREYISFFKGNVGIYPCTRLVSTCNLREFPGETYLYVYTRTLLARACLVYMSRPVILLCIERILTYTPFQGVV